MGCWSEQMTFGATGILNAQIRKPDSSAFAVLLDGNEVGEINWQMTGRHNVSNALAAICAARHVGVTPAVACEALSEFLSVKRRMEHIYDGPNLTVYDDFAHHPTAIATTLEGLRQSVGQQQILAIIEPGSHTMRLGTHAGRLKQSVQLADTTLWFQPQNLHWDMKAELKDDNNHLYTNIEEMVQAAIDHASMGFEHIIIMSNSGFGGMAQKLVARLKQAH